MLKRLQVRNYILIDELDISLDKGLSIITGETGAGKSIILGALGLMLGQRADAGLLLNKEKKCIIEGTFDISSYDLASFFHENELDFEKESIIRREINSDGKSRAFINDTPVNISTLKDLASRLVDIHSQHETLLLSSSRFQLNVVDAYAGNKVQVDAFRTLFKEYKTIRQELDELVEAERKSRSDLDYFRFQFNELAALQLKDGEQETMEQEQERLEHAEEILSQLGKATGAIYGADDNLVNQLQTLQQVIAGLKKYDELYATLANRIQSLIIELKDVYEELNTAADHLQVDPNRLEQINDRLSAIYSLQKKHRLSSVSELLKMQEELEAKIQNIGSLEDRISASTKQLEQCRRDLMMAGEKLSSTRREAIPGIEKTISKQLSSLAMPHAVLRIALLEEKDEQWTADGLEKVQFLFSANKGMDFKELSKVASGGEMSRLMLCIKSLMAGLSAMPTIIFDEIDTGISGETAAKVGAIMKEMARKHQVIAITHLPQMASKGDAHFLVYKETKKGTTRSFLRPLTDDERVQEIARMLSGEELTAAALENARELLSQ
jgi:DNA repair protein RecN (Recombination protein N)